jgi:hypothetical protein
LTFHVRGMRLLALSQKWGETWGELAAGFR